MPIVKNGAKGHKVEDALLLARVALVASSKQGNDKALRMVGELKDQKMRVIGKSLVKSTATKTISSKSVAARLKAWARSD